MGKNTIIQNSEQYIKSQGYTYFAFISYKHEDEKWAMWLKKKLQSYRLPTKTHKTHNDLPLRISPVFLDKDHMKPGELSQQEREEVNASKYLIVICSRNAHNASKNLDDEIQYFIDGGADRSRIIPFIVDDAPHPEEDCFPLKLHELCQEGNIIGANVNDSGKNNAVLKVVAYMHGIKLEELESEEKRRQKKNKTILSVVAAVLLIIIGASGYKCWDYFVPKYNYYIDYTEAYGLPVGIGELSKKETKGLYGFYTIIERYGKIQELRHENSFGSLLDSEWIEKSDRYIRATYSYTKKASFRK